MRFDRAINLVTAVCSGWAAMYLLTNARTLAERPRRGTALRLSARGYVLLGCILVFVGVSEIVTALGLL